MKDAAWMRRALDLAGRGWGRVAPNPLVGAVVVRDGTCVGEGYHREYGHPHAEVEALAAAGEAARGSTVYVTLEPCAHFGKTPPCTEALIAAGVRRVVYAASDPNKRARGGADVLRSAGLEVRGGVEDAAARDQNAPFFHEHGEFGGERPFVALKLALTLDARIADRQGQSVWITGEPARAETHRLRAGYDAVAVGIGTALADDPLLTVRGSVQPRTPPVRVVFDRSARLPLDGRMARSVGDAPLWMVVGSDAASGRTEAAERAGIRVLRGDSMQNGLRALRSAGLTSLFVEGGGSLASAVLRARVVDRMHLFYAPLLLGADGLNPFAGIFSPAIAEAHRWRRVSSAALGDDVLITLSRD